MPKAGAMAAPAITVSSDIDRMVAVTFLETLFFSIKIMWSCKLYRAIESFSEIGSKGNKKFLKALLASKKRSMSTSSKKKKTTQEPHA